MRQSVPYLNLLVVHRIDDLANQKLGEEHGALVVHRIDDLEIQL